MPLALLAGSGLDAVLARIAPRRGFGVAVRGAAVAGVAGLALAPVWPERWLVAPCPFGDLPVQAVAIAPAGAPVGVVVPEGFSEAALVAQHTGREVVDARTAEELAAPAEVDVAFLLHGAGVPQGFAVVAEHGAWRLARRVR
jgi:hypothetical protein